MICSDKMDMLLLHYAAGTLGSAESLLVSALLTLNAEARKKVIAFEQLGGELMQEAPAAALSSCCLEGVLEKIAAKPGIQETPRCPASPPPGPEIPPHLCALLYPHGKGTLLCWSRVTPGLQKMDVPACPQDASRNRLKLMYIEPRQSTPAHRHRSTEITLVLQGEYTDASGTYRTGDIVVVEDPAFVHSPTAGSEGCLCLMMTETPLRFENRINRFLNVFLRV